MMEDGGGRCSNPVKVLTSACLATASSIPAWSKPMPGVATSVAWSSTPTEPRHPSMGRHTPGRAMRIESTSARAPIASPAIRALLHRALLHRALLHRALLHRALLHRALLHRALLHRA